MSDSQDNVSKSYPGFVEDHDAWDEEMRAALDRHQWTDEDYACVARNMADDPLLAPEVSARLRERTPGSLVSLVTERYQRRMFMRAENAEWTTAYVNDLPDSAFLYIKPGGEKDSDGKTVPRSLRYFPVRNAEGSVDLPHVRNAIARAPQANLPDDVIARVQSRARRLLQEGQKATPRVDEALIGDLIDFGLRHLSKSLAPNVWMGVSHNAWQDRSNDIIPLALILDDINHQTRLIQSGKMHQYGQGLWQDHNRNKVLGDCAMRVVIEGGRSCFEMGNLYGGLLPKASMSIGYNALMGDDDRTEYKAVYIYERSRLEETIPVNARTFWSSKQRMPDAHIALVARELINA